MALSEEKVMDIIKESNISLLSVAYSTRSVGTVSIQRLPVFLSAAEHLNFTRAAEEQCISQTAVSQQIKLLEQELGYALKFMRIINLVLTAIFGVWGYVGGIVILAVSLLFNRTVSSRSYLYPLVPFHGKQLGHQLFRTRLPAARK